MAIEDLLAALGGSIGADNSVKAATGRGSKPAAQPGSIEWAMSKLDRSFAPTSNGAGEIDYPGRKLLKSYVVARSNGRPITDALVNEAAQKLRDSRHAEMMGRIATSRAAAAVPAVPQAAPLNDLQKGIQGIPVAQPQPSLVEPPLKAVGGAYPLQEAISRQTGQRNVAEQLKTKPGTIEHAMGVVDQILGANSLERDLIKSYLWAKANGGTGITPAMVGDALRKVKAGQQTEMIKAVGQYQSARATRNEAEARGMTGAVGATSTGAVSTPKPTTPIDEAVKALIDYSLKAGQSTLAESAQTAKFIDQEAIKKIWPTGGFFTEKGHKAFTESDDPSMRMLYHALNNLDPTQIPAFAGTVLSAEDLAALKQHYGDKFRLAASGDAQAARDLKEEIAGFIYAGVLAKGVHAGIAELKGLGVGERISPRGYEGKFGEAPPTYPDTPAELDPLSKFKNWVNQNARVVTRERGGFIARAKRFFGKQASAARTVEVEFPGIKRGEAGAKLVFDENGDLVARVRSTPEESSIKGTPGKPKTTVVNTAEEGAPPEEVVRRPQQPKSVKTEPTSDTAEKPVVEEPNASEKQVTETVHGDVRTSAPEGEGKLPAEEGGKGIRPDEGKGIAEQGGPEAPKKPVAPAEPAKEAWQLTKQAFKESRPEPIVPGSPEEKAAEDEHRKAVREALHSGKPVPEEVFKEYPEEVTSYLQQVAHNEREAAKPTEDGEQSKLDKALADLDRTHSVRPGFEPTFESEKRHFPSNGPSGVIVVRPRHPSPEGPIMQIAAYDANKRLIGTFSGLLDGDNKGAFKITVADESQRQGVGKRLLDKAKDAGFDVLGSISANKFTHAGRQLMRSWLTSTAGQPAKTETTASPQTKPAEPSTAPTLKPTAKEDLVLKPPGNEPKPRSTVSIDDLKLFSRGWRDVSTDDLAKDTPPGRHGHEEVVWKDYYDSGDTTGAHSLLQGYRGEGADREYTYAVKHPDGKIEYVGRADTPDDEAMLIEAKRSVEDWEEGKAADAWEKERNGETPDDEPLHSAIPEVNTLISLADKAGAFDSADEREAIAKLYEQIATTYAKNTGTSVEDYYKGLKVRLNLDSTPEALLQELAAPFYSKLERVIQEKVPNKASAEQIRKTLEAAGVKKEEMEWTGTSRLLDRGGTFTKDDLLTEVRANAITISEVMQGGTGAIEKYEDLPETMRKLIDRLDGGRLTQAEFRDLARARGYEAEFDMAGDLEHIRKKKGPLPTRYDDYKLAGGTDYRELLLRIPLSGAGFRSPHWTPDNVVVHVRFDTRPTPSGQSLHIAEIQSDWHQKGRKQGYRQPAPPEAQEVEKQLHEAQVAADAAEDELDRITREFLEAKPKIYVVQARPNDQGRWTTVSYHDRQIEAILEAGRYVQTTDQYVRNWKLTPYDASPEVRAARHRLDRARIRVAVKQDELDELMLPTREGVPDAPFKTAWPELALKRMIRYAAENGYDSISWDSGATNAQRYSLERHVSKISYSTARNYLEAWDLKGDLAIERHVEPAELENAVGKEIAERLLARTPEETANHVTSKTLSDVELKVGGEGMKSFYDQMLPSIADKLGKRFGAKTERGSVSVRTRRHGRMVYEGPEVSPDEIGEIIRKYEAGDNPFTHVLDTLRLIKRRREDGISTRDAATISGNTIAAKLLGGKLTSGEQTVSHPVHVFKITKALSAYVLNEGQPLFQAGHQGAKAWYDVTNRTIGLFTHVTDVSSLLHEGAHDWMNPKRLLPEHVAVLEEHFGPAGSKDYYEGSARAFESYMRSGEAPVPALKRIFEIIKAAMLRIYRSIIGTPLKEKIAPEVKRVFDEMLGKEMESKAVAPEPTSEPVAPKVEPRPEPSKQLAEPQYESAALRQYFEIKAAHPDTLIAMRIGDFYEFYGKDAEVAAQVLEITLTGRDDKIAGRIPMAGVPYHSVEKYLARLVAAGHKVALVDHKEDPKTAKGEPERGITRIEEPAKIPAAEEPPIYAHEILADYPHTKRLEEYVQPGMDEDVDVGHIVEALKAAKKAGLTPEQADEFAIWADRNDLASKFFDKGAKLWKEKNATIENPEEGSNGYDAYSHDGGMIDEKTPSMSIDDDLAALADQSHKPVQRTPEDIAEKKLSYPGEQISKGIALMLAKPSASLTWRELQSLADAAFGGTMAEGKYTARQMYDAVEAGVNRYLAEERLDQWGMDDYRKLLDRLPTQTMRTEGQTLLQQFSTPWTEAYAAFLALGDVSGLKATEPSAGTGNLAMFLERGGATVLTNEFPGEGGDYRAAILKSLGFKVERVDAERLDAYLPDLKNDVVLMNPPFSSTGGRTKNNKTEYGASHVASALSTLVPGGRLVAIVGRGMGSKTPQFHDWFVKMGKKGYQLRADLLIDGEEYKKLGTTFDNRILVFDNAGANAVPIAPITTTEPISAEAASKILKGIGNERSGINKPGSGVATSPSVQGPVIVTEHEPGTTRPEPVVEPPASVGGRGDVDAGGPTPEVRAESGRGGEGVPGTEPTSVERTPAANGEGSKSGGSGKPANERAATEVGGGTRDGDRSELSAEEHLRLSVDEGHDDAASEEGAFTTYAPKLSKGKPHPTELAETVSMSGVELPIYSLEPKQLDALLHAKYLATEGNLSSAQLETVLQAAQRFTMKLDSGARLGMYVGDGTGVGKGREAAAIIANSWAAGVRRIVWMTVNDKDLMSAADRDLTDVMGDRAPSITSMTDVPVGKDIKVKDGVLVFGYPKLAGKGERLSQLAEWLAQDHTGGLIILDEAHKAANVSPGAGGKASKTGERVVLLQNMLPNARVLYMSATGATVPREMAYLVRMGLWGAGQTFEEPGAFISYVASGGLGAMEMVAREMKAQGGYVSRMIPFKHPDGTPLEFEEVVTHITPEMEEMADNAAAAWAKGLEMATAELEGLSPAARRNFNGQYWGAHQRFFRSLYTAMKVPEAIRRAERHLAEGKQYIFALDSTGESAVAEKLTQGLAEGLDISEIDITNKGALMTLIDRHFPTQLHVKVYNDVTEKEEMMPVWQLPDGKIVNAHAQPSSEAIPVLDPELVAAKEAIKKEVGELKVPGSPIDMIINHFGRDNVSELTGRKTQVIYDDEGTLSIVKRTRPRGQGRSVNDFETDEFNSGKRKIAIVSRAAAQGISLHASAKFKSQVQRIMGMLELGWQTKEEIQKMGRPHRSGQVIGPGFELFSINVAGDTRFSSALASRIASMGAIQRGDRASSSAGALAQYDFNSPQGAAAAWTALRKANRFLVQKMGLFDGNGNLKLPDDQEKAIGMFFNRLMVLPVKEQNALYEAFQTEFTNLVARAKEDGEFGAAVEDIKAQSLEVKDRQVVATDPNTKAQTVYWRLEGVFMLHPINFTTATVRIKFNGGWFAMSPTGKIGMAHQIESKLPDGGTVTRYRFVGPSGASRTIEAQAYWKFRRVENNEAEAIWNTQVEALPTSETRDVHVLTGLVMPFIRRIEGASKVVRVRVPGHGKLVGIMMDDTHIHETLTALGVKQSGSDESADSLFSRALAMASDEYMKLAEGLAIRKKMFRGSPSLQVETLAGENVSPEMAQRLKAIGLIDLPVSAFDKRLGVPTDRELGPEVFGKLIEKFPIIQMPDGKKPSSGGGGGGNASVPVDEQPPPTSPYPEAGTLVVEEGGTPTVFSEAIDALNETFNPGARGGDVTKAVMLQLRTMGGERGAALARWETALKEMRVFFDYAKNDGWDWFDRIERGIAQKDAKRQAYAKIMRSFMDAVYNDLSRVRNGAIGYILNYMPHMYKNPAAARRYFAISMAKKPLSGNKSYLKKRFFETMADATKPVEEGGGGLERAFDNPVEMGLAHLVNANKYITMVDHVLGPQKALGIAVFKPIYEKTPEGAALVNDEAYTVYDPGVVKVWGAFDKVQREKLEEFAKSIGVHHSRKARIGGTRAGFSEGRLGITTKIGGPNSVIAHEIGHQVDDRYGLWNYFASHKWDKGVRAAEMRALADLRFEGSAPSDYFQRYVRKKEEKIAVMFEAYLHAPDKFKAVAPKTFRLFEEFMSSKPELAPFLKIKPSVVLGVESGEVRAAGMHILGHWVVPEPVARVMNNYLSPGLAQHDLKLVKYSYRGVRSVNNAMKMATLSLSTFHAFFVINEALVSTISEGIYDLVNGAIRRDPKRMLSGAATGLMGITPGMNIFPVIKRIWDGIEVRRAYRAMDGALSPDMRLVVDGIINANIHVTGLQGEYGGGAMSQFAAAIRRGKWGTASLKSAAALLEAVSHLIMGQLVPLLKAGTFKYMFLKSLEDLHAAGNLPDYDGLRTLAANIGDMIEDRYGQMNRDNLFWDRAALDIVTQLALSPTWAIGTYRALGGGLKDIAAGDKSKHVTGDWFSRRTAYLLAYPVAIGIVGYIVNRLMTGKDPESALDLYFPRTGRKNADGTAERVSIPGYQKDVYNLVNEPVRAIMHKQSPMVGLMSDLGTGRDFEGRATTGSIFDISRTFGEKFTPISLSGVQNRSASSGIHPVLPFLGITKAPVYVSRSKALNLAKSMLAQNAGGGISSEAQIEARKARTEAIQARRNEEPLSVGVTREVALEAARLSKLPPLAAAVQKLHYEQMLPVVQAATKQERAEIRRVVIEKAVRAVKSGKMSKETWQELKAALDAK